MNAYYVTYLNAICPSHVTCRKRHISEYATCRTRAMSDVYNSQLSTNWKVSSCGFCSWKWRRDAFISNFKPHRSTHAMSHVYAALGRDSLVSSTDHTRDTAVAWTCVDVTRPTHMGHNYSTTISAYGTRLYWLYLCIWDTTQSYHMGHFSVITPASYACIQNLTAIFGKPNPV